MSPTKERWRYSAFTRMCVTATLLAMLLGFGAFSGFHSLSSVHPASSCKLAEGIKHVIYIQFDNTHFTRDNPNVPSDLEQMPHLRDFLKNKGVLLSHHHTQLISHTANGFLTSQTGVYPNRHGMPISNVFAYFNPDGTYVLPNSDVINNAASFAYWTAPVYDQHTLTPTDKRFNLLTAQGKNAPAPWAPYTRAGCSVGEVTMANTVLQNAKTDIPQVFGPHSPEAQEAAANENQAFADFIGIGVHCAKGDGLCSSANNGRPDVLPDEPGGYTGYQALFGHKYVAPQIHPNGPMQDLNGNIIQYDKDGDHYIGYPGPDVMLPAGSLAYVAAMQEHGVPITYAYLPTAHEDTAPSTAYNPGQKEYVDRLKAYDDAFSKFFDRLGHDGINETNTLFVFTVDEGDHFTGDAPSLPDCDGLHTTCDYSRTKNLGYLTVRLSGLLARQAKVTTPFALRQGAVYVNGNPTRTAVETRTLERSMSHLNVMNPLTGHKEQFIGYLADPVEMELLHMITSDSARTPSFMAFPKPDYYLTTDNSQECLRAEADCVKEDRRSNWNHDAIAPEINTIWLGMVGPGVKRLGIDDQVWSDSTDTRPTMLVALGLKDDYSSSGRVLFEVLEDKAVPRSLLAHRETLTQLAQMYKQLNAPVGELGLASLKVSTQALESAAPNDSTYTDLEDKLRAITPKRNDLADKMSGVLEGAAFHDQPINESQARGFIQQGEQLLEQMNSLLVRSNAPS